MNRQTATPPPASARGTRIALIFALVAERLSQPEGAWRPFEPQGAPGWLYRLLTHEALPI